ncbi:uncharacterized protein LOC111243811 isoform X3 [Varroa destructor]|uniref:Uncharacterized protein n=1 Tax=Varroa destructor TaxID=109461 RepID=A0A7M7J3M3_VARDE|nr:uncharacterized protein LOC111243811 isoform X3 [Varroa destructor]
MECRLLCASPEMLYNVILYFQTVERQLRSLIREHHRLIETAEQLGSSAADSKLRAASRIQQEIINKAYQLKYVSEVYRDSMKVPSHVNGDIPLPKSLAQKQLIAQSTVSVSKETPQAAKDDFQLVADRVVIKKRKNAPEPDSQKDSSQIKFSSKINTSGAQSDSSATPTASVATALTPLSAGTTIKQDATTKPVSLPVINSNVLVHQQQATTNGIVATPTGLKLPSAAKPALFIIKVPPSQAGQFNIVTVQPHLNAVSNRNGLNGITGVVNGIGVGGTVNGLPVNGTVVLNNLNGLPLNNLTSLANLNTTLSNALNGGINNNNSINNNNTLQLNNCKIVSVPTPVTVQKVAAQPSAKHLEDDAPSRRALSVASPSLLSVQCEISSRTFDADDASPPRCAGAMFEKVARTHKQQAWFLANIGLCTRDKHRELLERRKERRRRKTANPQFSAAAMEERRRLESLRRKKKLVIPDGKSKLEFKEELEQRAEKLKSEREELLKKHEQTQQRLLEERTRTQILNEEHRVMEETLERLRSFVTLLAEERSTFRWT